MDLATFDVVVDLEGDKPSFAGRIRIPQEREPHLRAFLVAFRIESATWSDHAAPGWREVTFPVIAY